MEAISSKDARITFDDIAGIDQVKSEITEVVSFLKDPSRFLKLGARSPAGVLLVGPPGTGKTLLAKAIAGEAGVPFFSIAGTEFMEMFVGVGASRVRDMFQQARDNVRAIDGFLLSQCSTCMKCFLSLSFSLSAHYYSCYY